MTSPTTDRSLRFHEAIRESLEICMERDAAVVVMGLGVPDPKGVFGTTAGLQERFGASRVCDIPCSENGVTGIAIGAAMTGLRPVLTHQRLDFALLSMEQIVNQAAKWRYMFGGRQGVPLVVRLIVGRGWGQGPQHSQNLQAWFAHIPGLKVVAPATPRDAKGLLISAIEDDDPVIFIEHRWLHNIAGPVPEGHYRETIGQPRIIRAGTDVTIVASSHATLESVRAAECLSTAGISAEVVDLRTLNPLDDSQILQSVRKTCRLVVVDPATRTGGFSGEIIARVAESACDALKARPVRITLPDHPVPTSPALSRDYYPRHTDIAVTAARLLGREIDVAAEESRLSGWRDVPDPTFTGPF